LESARTLSRAMMRLGGAAGLPTTCMLSSMDEPLGCAVGNALEVAEAVATLEGHGPADLTELCLVAAGLMLGDRAAAEDALGSGRALAVYRGWIAAQGGDPAAPLPEAPQGTEVRADRSGDDLLRRLVAAGGVVREPLGPGRVRPSLRPERAEVHRVERLHDPGAAQVARKQFAGGRLLAVELRHVPVALRVVVVRVDHDLPGERVGREVGVRLERHGNENDLRVA